MLFRSVCRLMQCVSVASVNSCPVISMPSIFILVSWKWMQPYLIVNDMEVSPFDYMKQFWRENEVQMFSAKETQLYFFFLSESNRLYWRNPFGCSTQRITNNLGISRQTLCRLRKKLQDRGSKSTLPKEPRLQPPTATSTSTSPFQPTTASSLKTKSKKSKTVWKNASV